MLLNRIEISYEVKKIIFRNSETGFSIANIKIKDHPEDIKIPTSETIVRGIFKAIHVKDDFTSIGCWKDYGEMGYQFDSLCAKSILPETNKGIVKYLQNFASGIGLTLSKRIVDKYGPDTLNVIRSNPESLIGIKGLTAKRLDSLIIAVKENVDFEEVVLFLMNLGLNYTDSSLVYEQFGYSSIDKVKANPYMLSEFTNLNFKSIDQLAYSVNISPYNNERLRQSLLYFIEIEMKNKGDMFVYEKDIKTRLNDFINKVGYYDAIHLSENKIKEIIDELVLLKKITIDYNKNSEVCVYFSFYHHIEVEIVSLIKKLLTEPSLSLCLKEDVPKLIQSYELESKMKLATKQKMAIKMALTNRISILTGGPGTGKTHTIKAIINSIKALNKTAIIELCAPTGRAAKRMTELTGMKAQTIHRLIELNNVNSKVSELKTIEADYLIVDESSMIDAFVFYSLLSSVSETTKLLIVGDHEQLPSVGAGLILRDLIDTKLIPTTVLDEIFRQAKDSQIIVNSHKLIQGFKTTDENGLKFDESKGDFYFIERFEKEKIRDGVLQVIGRLLYNGDSLDDVQVLSVMNKGDLGVVELNKKIQEIFNNSQISIKVGDRIFKKNDRVMQLVNNYDINVFNGEIGKIDSIIENPDGSYEIMVDYGDKDVLYDYKNIDEITLSYAITVHKSQGSEFPKVIMPIHSSLGILMNRNIVYTGWTRAKDRVVMIGSKEVLDMAVGKTDNTIRNSLIKYRLTRELKVNKPA